MLKTRTPMLSRLNLLFTLVGLTFSIVGCRQDMYNQSKYKTYAPSSLFDDGRSARPLEKDVVARGRLKDDPLYFRGMENDKPARRFPYPITEDILVRGQDRYTIFCSACHDKLGTGRGMAVQRGFPQPPSFHTERLRQVPPGYIFDVITNGFGRMYSYAARIPEKDRWAIVAHVRVLQRSQEGTLADVPAEHKNNIKKETEWW